MHLSYEGACRFCIDAEVLAASALMRRCVLLLPCAEVCAASAQSRSRIIRSKEVNKTVIMIMILKNVKFIHNKRRRQLNNKKLKEECKMFLCGLLLECFILSIYFVLLFKCLVSLFFGKKI